MFSRKPFRRQDSAQLPNLPTLSNDLPTFNQSVEGQEEEDINKDFDAPPPPSSVFDHRSEDVKSNTYPPEKVNQVGEHDIDEIAPENLMADGKERPIESANDVSYLISFILFSLYCLSLFLFFEK